MTLDLIPKFDCIWYQFSSKLLAKYYLKYILKRIEIASKNKSLIIIYFDVEAVSERKIRMIYVRDIERGAISIVNEKYCTMQRTVDKEATTFLSLIYLTTSCVTSRT